MLFDSPTGRMVNGFDDSHVVLTRESHNAVNNISADQDIILQRQRKARRWSATLATDRLVAQFGPCGREVRKIISCAGHAPDYAPLCWADAAFRGIGRLVQLPRGNNLKYQEVHVGLVIYLRSSALRSRVDHVGPESCIYHFCRQSPSTLRPDPAHRSLRIYCPLAKHSIPLRPL